MNKNLRISAYTVTSGVGVGVQRHREALAMGKTGLRACDFEGVGLQTYIGRVDGVEDIRIEGEQADYDCRNNRLALLGLRQDGFMDAVHEAKQQYGAARIGVFLGTSTSGILSTELAYARRDPVTGALPSDFNYQTTQNVYSLGDYVRRELGLDGPTQVISTACSSSAKVFAAAHRHMLAGLCDVAVVGGVDSLCQMTLYGFNSLQLVSEHPCRPADKDRDGINIGEAAGFALVEWAGDGDDLCVLGYGESSDAHHISSPHPEGKGAALAMTQALDMAGLKATDIDYINLHGTATPANDASEDRGVMSVFGSSTPCSSTKGFTGHTLGAAGIVEAAFSCIAVEESLIPPSLNTQTVDDAIKSGIVLEPLSHPVNRVLSNSFGFGGSNASLVIGRPL